MASSRGSKTKGRKMQNEVRDSILAVFPELDEYDDVVPTLMGESGVDIKLSAKARRRVPLAIESKCVELLNIWKALEQARKNARNDYIPAVVFRRNRTGPHVALPWPAFLDILRRLFDAEKTLKDQSRSRADRDLHNQRNTAKANRKRGVFTETRGYPPVRKT